VGIIRGSNVTWSWSWPLVSDRLVPRLRISGAVPPLRHTSALSDSSLGTEITLVIMYLKLWSRDSAAGVMTRLQTGRFGGSNSGRGGFFSSKRPDRFWSPTVFLFSWYRVSFWGVKRSERGVDHSCPSSAEVKNEWSYTSTSPTCLHGLDREKFTFYVFYLKMMSYVAYTGTAWSEVMISEYWIGDLILYVFRATMLHNI